MVTGITADIGLPSWVQMLSATLAESLRESVTGPISMLFGFQSNTPSLVSEIQSLMRTGQDITGLDILNKWAEVQTQAQLQAEQESTIQKYSGLLLSTLGAIALISSGLGVFATPLMSSMISTSVNILLEDRTQSMTIKDYYRDAIIESKQESDNPLKLSRFDYFDKIAEIETKMAAEFGPIVHVFMRGLRSGFNLEDNQDYHEDTDRYEIAAERRRKMITDITFQIEKYYPDRIDKIDSLATLSKKYGLDPKSSSSRKTLNDFLSEEMYRELFTDRAASISKIKKERLFNVLDGQFARNFPDDIDKIWSIGKLAQAIHSGRKTIRKWVNEYLEETFDEKAAQIHADIWMSKSTAEHRMDYDKVLDAKPDGYTLITTRAEFDAMEEIPSMRDVILECRHGHQWSVRTSRLIYKGTICQDCDGYRCQAHMRDLMQKIFGILFPAKTFTKIFGIPYRQKVDINKYGNTYSISVGQLHFDGYNARVIINGKTFKIAFEYDGGQHDDPDNYLYTQLGNDYYLRKAQDYLKDQMALDNDIILIRLKSIDDFNLKKLSNLDKFQAEIIRQFELQTKEKLTNIPEFKFDKIANTFLPTGNNFIGDL